MSDVECRCSCGLYVEVADVSNDTAARLVTGWYAMLGTHTCAGRPLNPPVIRPAKG